MSELIAEPTEVGTWMLESAIDQWMQYDEGDFKVLTHEEDGELFSVSLIDQGEGKEITLSPLKFFKEHKRLIWEGEMSNVEGGAAPAWWNFASKVNGADADEYDSNTTDFVLQVLMYGEIIYS